MTSTVESLTEAYLIQLATAIGLSDTAKESKDAASKLVGYSNIFTTLKFIPGAEPWASLIGGVIKSVGESTASVGDLKKLNLTERKSTVVAALRKLDKPIIVFVDDLDRLVSGEVLEMIRVIKAVADFPGVVYLIAFDVDHVKNALIKAGIDSPIEYLEKIVQVRLNLPIIAKSDLEAIINKEISKLPSKLLRPFQKEDPGRLAHLYHHGGISKLIETPRDISRVINRLIFKADALSGEVAFPDLFAFEVLGAKFPEIHDRIYLEPDYFFRYTKPVISRFENDKSRNEDPFEKITDGVDARLRPSLLKLLRELFPLFSESSTSGERRRLRGLGRLAAPDRLYAVLAFDIPPSELPLSQLKLFLMDKTTRNPFIRKFIKSENLDQFVECIQSFSEIEIDDIENYVLTLAAICASRAASDYDKRVANSFLGISASRLMWDSVIERLDRASDSERFEIILKVISSVKSSQFSCDAIVECFRQHTSSGSFDERGRARKWFEREINEQLVSEWGDRHLPLLLSETSKIEDLRVVIRAARFVCPDRLPKFCNLLLSSNEGVDRLARALGRTGLISPGGPYVQITDDLLSSLGDVGLIRQRALRRISGLKHKSDLEFMVTLKSLADGKGYFIETGQETQ